MASPAKLSRSQNASMPVMLQICRTSVFDQQYQSTEGKPLQRKTQKSKQHKIQSESKKIPPTVFWIFFPKRLGISDQFFTHLL